MWRLSLKGVYSSAAHANVIDVGEAVGVLSLHGYDYIRTTESVPHAQRDPRLWDDPNRTAL